MKNIKITFIVLCLSALSVAQVGIGTNIPVAGAILELKATDKSLLLSRVATTAAVTSPVNGMMIYDISSNCIKGYQNSAWTGCLSACSATSGVNASAMFSWQTNLRFKQFANVQTNGSNTFGAGGVTTDGKVFFWGRDVYGNIENFKNTGTIMLFDTKWKQSPVYCSGTGLWGDGNAIKVQLGNDAYYVLDTNGNVWSWGSQQSGQLGDGVNGANVTVRNDIPFSIAKPSGVTKFLDIQMRYRTLVLLGDNGKAYYFGRNEFTGVGTLTATQISFPTGVTTYTKIWMGNERSGAYLFLMGNDGNLYSTGTQIENSGNATVATGTGSNTFATIITKVNMPAGEAAKIVKVDSDDLSTFALTSEGKLYVWGKVANDFGAGATLPNYGTIYQCMFSDNTGVTTVANGSWRDYYAYNPKLVKLPTGETSFIDVTAAVTTNEFLCSSGKAYVLGYQTYVNEAGAFGTPSSMYVSYTDYQIIYALEYVSNVKQLSSSGYSTLALDGDGKLWGFGRNDYCMTGAGYKAPSNISSALPLMNGNLDPNNPRPQTVN